MIFSLSLSLSFSLFLFLSLSLSLSLCLCMIDKYTRAMLVVSHAVMQMEFPLYSLNGCL